MSALQLHPMWPCGWRVSQGWVLREEGGQGLRQTHTYCTHVHKYTRTQAHTQTLHPWPGQGTRIGGQFLTEESNNNSISLEMTRSYPFSHYIVAMSHPRILQPDIDTGMRGGLKSSVFITRQNNRHWDSDHRWVSSPLLWITCSWWLDRQRDGEEGVFLWACVKSQSYPRESQEHIIQLYPPVGMLSFLMDSWCGVVFESIISPPTHACTQAHTHTHINTPPAGCSWPCSTLSLCALIS